MKFRLAIAFGLALHAAGAVRAQTLEERIAACGSCHGEEGMPQEANVPIIWGQHTGYTYIQLRDFKNGDRKNEQMMPLVADLSREDMLKIADYFSKKTWPRKPHKASETEAARALRAAAAGQCVECHLGGYKGASVIPRLAGQQFDYLRKTMLDFKTKERANNSAMTDLFRTYPDEDLAAMASYLAGL
jgi:cytochrome c553